MAGVIINKPQNGWQVTPNLVDYGATCAAFSWANVERELSGLSEGRALNIAHVAIDRHAKGVMRDHLALRWFGKQGELRDFTFAELQRLTNRFANVLRGLGIGGVTASLCSREEFPSSTLRLSAP